MKLSDKVIDVSDEDTYTSLDTKQDHKVVKASDVALLSLDIEKIKELLIKDENKRLSRNENLAYRVGIQHTINIIKEKLGDFYQYLDSKEINVGNKAPTQSIYNKEVNINKPIGKKEAKKE